MNKQIEKLIWLVALTMLCQAIQVTVLFFSYSKQLEARYELYRIANIMERTERKHE